MKIFTHILELKRCHSNPQYSRLNNNNRHLDRRKLWQLILFHCNHRLFFSKIPSKQILALLRQSSFFSAEVEAAQHSLCFVPEQTALEKQKLQIKPTTFFFIDNKSTANCVNHSTSPSSKGLSRTDCKRIQLLKRRFQFSVRHEKTKGKGESDMENGFEKRGNGFERKNTDPKRRNEVKNAKNRLNGLKKRENGDRKTRKEGIQHNKRKEDFVSFSFVFSFSNHHREDSVHLQMTSGYPHLLTSHSQTQRPFLLRKNHRKIMEM